MRTHASPRSCECVRSPFTVLEISYFCCDINGHLKSGNRITQTTHSFSVYEAVLSMRFHNQNHVLVPQCTHNPFLIIHLIILPTSYGALTGKVYMSID